MTLSTCQTRFAFLIILAATIFVPCLGTGAQSMKVASHYDCQDWLHLGARLDDGVYSIDPNDTYKTYSPEPDTTPKYYYKAPYDVYCDMTSNGGGWTVIQRRIDNSTMFWSRKCDDYKNGFGNADGNYWLGLRKIQGLFYQRQQHATLRVDLFGNRNCLPNGEENATATCDPNAHFYGEWGGVRVLDRFYLDIIRVSTRWYFNGTLSDGSMMHSQGSKFRTADDSQTENCLQSFCASTANHQTGPWWYRDDKCGTVGLNGKYDPVGDAPGFSWTNDDGFLIRPVKSEIKIRKMYYM